MRIEDAKAFIIKNARPLELSLYRYFFENGTREAVIEELAKYQNEDGGFGHGLEADNWNPDSNPIAVNDALITLYRIGGLDATSPIVQRIVSYLSSHDSFDEEKRRWLFCIDSNANYPHAVWWEKGEGDGINGFNPTVSLAAFMVCYGNDIDYYAAIVREAVANLKDAGEIAGDALKCYLLAYELLSVNNRKDVVDLPQFFKLLQHKLGETICKDKEKYGKEYVSAPSDFFDGRYIEFIHPDMQKWIADEKEVLTQMQKDDGGFDITWIWYNDYPEFEKARTWWRPRVTLDKLLFVI